VNPNPTTRAEAVVRIEHADDPRLALYDNLPDRQLQHLHDGYFIAEGELVVRRLVDSRYTLHSMLMVEGKVAELADVIAGLPAGVGIYIAPQPLISRIIGFPMHRGVLAIGRRTPMPGAGIHEPEWKTVARAARSLIILEDLTNHDNVGGIFRNVAALGGPGCAVLLTGRSADPLYRKAVRVSMGHVLSVPFARISSVEAIAPELRGLGFSLLALTTGPDSIPIDRAEKPRRPALILGTEGDGVSPASRACAEQRLVIPMARGVDSLNVYVAAAVAMHRLFVIDSATKD
jgi:tRNA G18 (ribose-2'-O)-methylase SpoU